MSSEVNSLPQRKKEDFEILFQETINEILNRILGEGTSDIIINVLSKKTLNNKIGNTEYAKLFSNELKDLIGTASVVIETLVLKSLYYKLRSPYEEIEGFQFLDHINKLENENFL
jgi:hypothetical protein